MKEIIKSTSKIKNDCSEGQQEKNNPIQTKEAASNSWDKFFHELPPLSEDFSMDRNQLPPQEREDLP